jgi:hypothetical protein
LDSGGAHLPIRATTKRALPFVVPFLAAGLIICIVPFLIFGLIMGVIPYTVFAVLILPGFILMYLMYFLQYAVILEKKHQ